MSIVVDFANSNPMPTDGIAFTGVFTVGDAINTTTTTTNVISALSDCPNGCSCDSCEFINIVFAEISITNPLYNDRRRIDGVAISKTSTVDFYLQKDDTDIAHLTDNTYGVLVAVGGYSSQPKLSTFMIDWQSVLTAFGEGFYTIKIKTKDIAGADVLNYSQDYNLLIYKPRRAEGTVVLNWFQNGRILDNPIDYTGLNLEQYSRIPAMIGWGEPKLTIDEIELPDHSFTQVQDKITTEYTLETRQINNFNIIELYKDCFLATSLIVTDFNFYNSFIINQLELKPTDIKVSPYKLTRLSKMTVKLSEKVRATIKRNYF